MLVASDAKIDINPWQIDINPWQIVWAWPISAHADTRRSPEDHQKIPRRSPEDLIVRKRLAIPYSAHGQEEVQWWYVKGMRRAWQTDDSPCDSNKADKRAKMNNAKYCKKHYRELSLGVLSYSSSDAPLCLVVCGWSRVAHGFTMLNSVEFTPKDFLNSKTPSRPDDTWISCSKLWTESCGILLFLVLFLVGGFLTLHVVWGYSQANNHTVHRKGSRGDTHTFYCTKSSFVYIFEGLEQYKKFTARTFAV